MIYGVYKNARDAAWQCILDYGINALPVKVSDITRRAGIIILKNSIVQELSDGQSGFTICQNGKCYVVYQDAEPPYRCRFTIAHELGHILLGHVLVDTPKYRTFSENDENENAANVFARDLLAPACVLHELNITSAEDISRVCNISMHAAEIRSERLRLLKDRNAWYMHPLERQVYKQFEPFIKKYRSESTSL